MWKWLFLNIPRMVLLSHTLALRLLLVSKFILEQKKNCEELGQGKILFVLLPSGRKSWNKIFLLNITDILVLSWQLSNFCCQIRDFYKSWFRVWANINNIFDLGSLDPSMGLIPSDREGELTEIVDPKHEDNCYFVCYNRVIIIHHISLTLLLLGRLLKFSDFS